jgi:hypothetical protein
MTKTIKGRQRVAFELFVALLFTQTYNNEKPKFANAIFSFHISFLHK